jgi:hypothetical protein
VVPTTFMIKPKQLPAHPSHCSLGNYDMKYLGKCNILFFCLVVIFHSLAWTFFIILPAIFHSLAW